MGDYKGDKKLISLCFDDSNFPDFIENVNYYFMFDSGVMPGNKLIETVQDIIDFSDTRMEIYEGFCNNFIEINKPKLYLKKLGLYRHFEIVFDDQKVYSF